MSRFFLIALLAVGALSARAGDGHDHGEVPVAAVAAAPRFAAVSGLFELVGVVDGDRVTFYLDRHADNTPVEGARLEVEFDGRQLALADTGSGVFEADLGAPLAPGVIAVKATVGLGGRSELLAGEFDVHGQEDAAEHAHGYPWGTAAIGFGAGALVAGALFFGMRRRPAGKEVMS